MYNRDSSVKMLPFWPANVPSYAALAAPTEFQQMAKEK